ncbi:MAG: flagellar basal-body rod protein FlgC [Deltaproteobacteria bacterium]|jgi:flagellar basal-body rod protein FlgC|nr:flagellar basal-body rod protein FlgC [Deltaproteobacteria bacterium]
MGMFDVLKISASGLRAQRVRMETIATNLANVHTTRTEEGGPFRKLNVIFESGDVSGERFKDFLARKLEGVNVEEIVESDKPFERTYDPGHPEADKDGYVTFPNVNVVEEMTDMMSATRSYEANTNVINATKHMFQKALEILK